MNLLEKREELVDKFLRRVIFSVIQLPSSSDKENNFLGFTESKNAGSSSTGSSSGPRGDNEVLDGDILEFLDHMCNCVRMDNQVHLPDDLKDGSLYETVKDIIEYTINSHDKKMGSKSINNSCDDKNMSMSNNLKLSMLVDKERIFQSNTLTNISKPILDGAENSRDLPFKPKLTEKPHSISDLEIKEIKISCSEDDDEIDDDNNTINSAASSHNLMKPSSYYAHPYENELAELSYNSILKTSEECFKDKIPIVLPKETSVQIIDDVTGFDTMIKTLSGCKDIAIDFQEHTYRSFSGFTCVMQISTRDEDFIIDTIKLWKSMHKLQVITTDPKILKVFHHSEHTIICLQRDFGLYIVNGFDTYFAAKELAYPMLSLANQVKIFCGVVLNQRFHMEDWRQRPLNEGMLNYAKNKTHYLLYIRDYLARDLWTRKGWQGMVSVLDSSKRACLQRYEKELFNPLGYLNILQKYRSLGFASTLTEAQVNTLATLWEWRDSVARDNDESVSYIMSNSEMLRIAVTMPKDVNILLTEIGPISSFVEESAAEIISVIKSNTINTIPNGHLSVSNRPSNEVVGDLLNTPVRKEDQRNINRAMADSPFAPEHGLDRRVLSPTTVGTQSIGSYSTGNFQTPISSTSRNRMRSPVLETEEIFKLAGWNTPSPVEARLSLSESPLTVESSSKMALLSSHSTEKQVESKSDLKFSSSSAFSAPVSSLSHGKKEIAELSASTENNLPKSLSEIYEISNRNKRRNKERKKARDGQTVSANSSIDEKEFAKVKDSVFSSIDNKIEFDTASVTSASSFDESAYFHAVENTAPMTAENTLEFVEMLGWLHPYEKKSVLENYLKEMELAAQNSHETDTSSNNESNVQNNSGFGSNYNQMRRSADSASSGGSLKSSGGGRGLHASSHNSSKGKDNNKGGGASSGNTRGSSNRNKAGLNNQDSKSSGFDNFRVGGGNNNKMSNNNNNGNARQDSNRNHRGNGNGSGDIYNKRY